MPAGPNYEWHVTAHAKARWAERINLPLTELEPLLNESKNIPKKLRKLLYDASKSEKHRESLRQGSGIYYWMIKGIIFVVDNCRVVTVFNLPEEFIEIRREARRRAKKHQRKYNAERKASELAAARRALQSPAAPTGASPSI